MEEFNYKFSQNCSILALNGVSNLVTKIRSLHKSPNQLEFNKHYKYLQEKCLSPKHSVASSAMLGLIQLTQAPEEVMPLNDVIKDIMSIVPTVHNTSGIIDLIFHALFKHNSTVPYDIMRNQHPLITVLKKDLKCWPHILARIEEKFKSEPRKKVLQRLQPFVLFVLYDYQQKLEQVLQIELLDIYSEHLDTIAKQKIIILNLEHMERSIRYCKVMLPSTPQLITYVISAIHELLSNDKDATEPIWIVHQYFSNHSPQDHIYALELAMICDCIPNAPITSMETLCDCIKLITSSKRYPTLITNIIKSCLLPWKLHFATSPIIAENVSSQIDELLSLQYQQYDIHSDSFQYLDETQHVFSFVLANLHTRKFLKKLEKARPPVIEMLFTILLGYLRDDQDMEDTLLIFDLCMKTCKRHPRYTTRLMPVLLDKIAGTIEPALHLELLRALPLMGVLKENITTIVMTIKAISENSTQMHAFALSLMYDLVLVNKFCFPYLEELLLKNDDKKDTDLDVAKAYVIRELCREMRMLGLDIYRKELVGFVSRSMSKTTDNNLVIKLNFEALKYLCQGCDSYVTLTSLEQKFEKTNNDAIIVGICGIMGEVGNIPDISDQKCEEVVKKLFEYTEIYPSLPILEAVYKALNNFTMEQIAVGFPNVYMHITNDNSILGSLAGACWVNLLQFGPSAGVHAVADMLIKFINLEMNLFRGSLDVHEGHQEPIHMVLTRDNILAAVAKFVKKNVNALDAINRNVYLECLRILRTRYARPLPAMDWSFLSNLLAHKDMLESVVAIASRQSSVSSSARRIIENYIKGLTEKNSINEEVIFVYNNLDMLWNSIQPVILKPFFKKTIKLGLLLMESSTDEIDFILNKILAMMKCPNASQSNKASAAETLIPIFNNEDMDSLKVEKILPIIGCVPRPYLFNDYSPVQFETVNDLIMMKCLAMHCATATAEDNKPFNLLDPIIDCRILKSCVQPAFNFEKMFVKLAPVFEKHYDHPTLPAWLTELASKINIELAEKKDMRNVIFASTVFLIGVTVASGYHIFTGDNMTLEEISAVFPFGLSRLLSTAQFAKFAPHVLESMYDFAINPQYRRNVLSEQISRTFKHGLLLQRRYDSFNDRFAWMKYIEVNF